MLDDRSYMRDPMYGSRRSMALNLIIVLVVCFVIENIILYYTRYPLLQYFGATPLALTKGWLWQLVSFNFLHAPFGNGGFFHILFNCWALWIFGHAVEETIGPKRLLILFLGTGVSGGLLQVIGSIALPSHFGMVTVGASAGVFAFIGAYGALYPSRQITMLLFFIIPVTITGRFLLIFSAIVAVFGIVIPSGGVAHGAHLGGLLAGMAFVRWALNSEWNMPRITFWKRPKVFIHKPGPSSADWGPGSQTPPEPPSEEFISREVDPILDKISAHGIQSLTDRERRILEAARAKMAKR